MEKKQGQITGLVSPLLESIRMKKIKKIVHGGDILDYGCGYGRLSEKIPFDTYTGVDLDTSVLSFAKDRNSNLQNIAFFSTEEFELINKRYDFIVLSAVIEHFKDPVIILKMLKARLKKQGKIIITTPTHFANTILDFGSRIGIFSRCAFNEHNQIFSKNDFYDIAKILNLKVIKYSRFECGMNQLVVFSDG